MRACEVKDPHLLLGYCKYVAPAHIEEQDAPQDQPCWGNGGIITVDRLLYRWSDMIRSNWSLYKLPHVTLLCHCKLMINSAKHYWEIQKWKSYLLQIIVLGLISRLILLACHSSNMFWISFCTDWYQRHYDSDTREVDWLLIKISLPVSSSSRR